MAVLRSMQHIPSLCTAATYPLITRVEISLSEWVCCAFTLCTSISEDKPPQLLSGSCSAIIAKTGGKAMFSAVF